VAGSASYSNGTYSLQGSGGDIWDAADGPTDANLVETGSDARRTDVFDGDGRLP